MGYSTQPRAVARTVSPTPPPPPEDGARAAAKDRQRHGLSDRILYTYCKCGDAARGVDSGFKDSQCCFLGWIHLSRIHRSAYSGSHGFIVLDLLRVWRFMHQTSSIQSTIIHHSRFGVCGGFALEWIHGYLSNLVSNHKWAIFF